MPRQKYLNNRDLLKQIHLSKNTFCSFIDEKYENYDIILKDAKKINSRSINKAKRNRAEKMQKEAFEANTKSGMKMADFEVDWRTIPREDLVFRVHTFEHIPKDPDRKKNPKQEADHHARLYFPPFFHYAFINEDDEEPTIVGKSHWDGGMDNGHFSDNHGQMTEELGRMFLKLAERYGTRHNWNGYSYNDEMQQQAIMQLSQVGLQFDETKSKNPFAYYTAIINASFTRIFNVEKRAQNIRDDILEMNDKAPSYTRQDDFDYGE